MLKYKGSLLAAAATYCALQACRPVPAGSVWTNALAKHRRARPTGPPDASLHASSRLHDKTLLLSGRSLSHSSAEGACALALRRPAECGWGRRSGQGGLVWQGDGAASSPFLR